MTALDSARAVREGEELPTEALSKLFAERLPDFAGALTVQQFPKGHSNLTYLIKAGDREGVLRRPPRGAKAIKSGHDMHREFTVLTQLAAVYPKVPRALLYVDEAESPLGAPFYVMERVPGIILRSAAPEGISLPPERMREIACAAIDNLVQLHALSPAAAGLADLGKPEGYVARQVEGWIGRCERSKTDDVPALDARRSWRFSI